MNGLCTNNRASLAQVEAVPVPQHTRSWKPVPYADALGFLKTTINRQLPYELESEEYGLSKDGNQMFGVLTLDTGDNAQGMAIGIRQSYNRSLALGIVVGAQVFVCDNLMFNGDAFKVVRKNTTNVWSDFRNLVHGQVGASQAHYETMQWETHGMKRIPVSESRGHELLGRALGERVLTPTQATVAFGDWRNARHEEFAPRNLWSFYNCMTEGLKKGRPATIMDRYAGAHDFINSVRAIA
jgi:hypothetical protein